MARKRNQLRRIEIVRDFTKYAAGSVLIKWGDTWVLCTASVSDKVPSFLRDTGKGWVTAEYSMLPGSTLERKERDIKKLKPDARGSEISRLIGRSLRAAVDLEKLGERLITIDCDVRDAIGKLLRDGQLAEDPIRHAVAAVSVGICGGIPTLDLDYALDSHADVDLNVVMTDDGRYVELQGTAEREPFTEDDLAALRALARAGLKKVFAAQKAAAR